MTDRPRLALPHPEVLHAAAARLGAELGCRLVALFGSTAREDPCPRDLDLAFLANHPLDVLALTNRLIRELGTQDVDVADLRIADPLLLAVVAREGVPLYESTPGEFARFVSLAMRRYADTRKFRELERREIQERLARLLSTP